MFSTNFHFVFCLPEELGPEPLVQNSFCSWGIDERFFMWLTHISLDSRRCNSGGRVRLWPWCWLLSGSSLFQASSHRISAPPLLEMWNSFWHGWWCHQALKKDSCFSVFNHRPDWDGSLFFIQFVCKYFQHSGNVQIIMSYFPSFSWL